MTAEYREDRRVRTVNIPTLLYRDRPYRDTKSFTDAATRLGDKILRHLLLDKCSRENPYVLYVHNTSLGKNPCVSMALRHIASKAQRERKPLWVLNEVHDFAENRRPDRWRVLTKCRGTRDKALALKVMYPNMRNFMYAALTSGDRENLLLAGTDPARTFILPNITDVSAYDSGDCSPRTRAEFLHRVASYAARQGCFFDRDARQILCPMKVMRRKNNLEAVLLLILFNSARRRYQLLITLDSHSAEDAGYSSNLKEFLKRRKLPAAVGFGYELISRDFRRATMHGKIVSFGMADLYHAADAVMITSVSEGFGLAYLEGWAAKRVVLGRRLASVADDLEEEGLDMRHMYEKIFVPLEWIEKGFDRIAAEYSGSVNALRAGYDLPALPVGKIHEGLKRRKLVRRSGRTCVDFADLSARMQLAVLEKAADDGSCCRMLFKLNPLLQVQQEMLDDPPVRLIERNHAVVKKAYSPEAGAVRFGNVLAVGNRLYDRPLVARQKRKKMSNKRIIEKYASIKETRLIV